MIPRLTQNSISFKANEALSPSDMYYLKIKKNFQTSQKQLSFVQDAPQNQMNNQIPMQGAPQKLDVIA